MLLTEYEIVMSWLYQDCNCYWKSIVLNHHLFKLIYMLRQVTTKLNALVNDSFFFFFSLFYFIANFSIDWCFYFNACMIAGAGSKTTPSINGGSTDRNTIKASRHFMVFLLVIVSCASTVTMFWELVFYRDFLF